jgi:putative mRNA 3-end processing factor
LEHPTAADLKKPASGRIFLPMIRPEDLLRPTPQGLYCPPGDFFIDPVRGGVDRAVVTHGHSDHARAGHRAVLATPQTLEAMAVRYGEGFTQSRQPAAYGEIGRAHV